MKNFVVIGLGSFGARVLRSLVARGAQVLVIDRDAERIQRVRDVATQAIKADVLNKEVLQEVLPAGLECAIIDLGNELHAAILVTNHLHKLGVPSIVVEADEPEQAEILRIVGATRIVFPEEEAAERVVGILTGRRALDFFAVSEEFSLIEVPVPEEWIGHTVVDLDLRRRRRLTVVAVRSGAGDRWRVPEPDVPVAAGDVVLLAGRTEHLRKL